MDENFASLFRGRRLSSSSEINGQPVFLRPLGKAFGITGSQLVMPCLDLCPNRFTWGRTERNCLSADDSVTDSDLHLVLANSFALAVGLYCALSKLET